jgi:hypothetical protein
MTKQRELRLMWQWHKKRAMADEISPALQRFHRRQAGLLGRRLKNRETASFDWQALCEAYRNQ